MDDLFVEEGVPVKRGLRELLRYLKLMGIRLWWLPPADGAGGQDPFHGGTGRIFDDSICGDEVTIGKPNPEVFLKACEKAGTAPEEALVLEDSEAGISAAFAAGIPVVCVPDMKYPEKEFVKKAGWIVESLHVVLEMFEKDQFKNS